MLTGRDKHSKMSNFVGGKRTWSLLKSLFAAFFVLSVHVLIPGERDELVPLAVKDKNIVRLPIR